MRRAAAPSEDGAHVTCRFCGGATTIEDGGAAMVREQRSRKEAEALYARLGKPPSWSQRFAVVLVNWKLWLVGLPFMVVLLARLAELPSGVVERWWERHRHARLVHVASPAMGWLLTVGWAGGLAILLLVWSLFGERIDARRDLQAALASKPPRTPGGPSRCHHCDAALDVPPNTPGVRCPYCGADNLLELPAAWIAKASHIDSKLRLDTAIARSRAIEGRRRVIRAALWRVPLVIGVLVLVGLPAVHRRDAFGWRDARYRADKELGLYMLVIHHDHAEPTMQLRPYVACDDAGARRALAAKARLAVEDTTMCEQGVCTGAAMFALAHGERLRLVWATPGAMRVRVGLADRNYLGGPGVLWDGFGDEIVTQSLAAGTAGTTAIETPIELGGWYKVDLRAVAGSGVAVEPCVVPAPD